MSKLALAALLLTAVKASAAPQELWLSPSGSGTGLGTDASNPKAAGTSAQFDAIVNLYSNGDSAFHLAPGLYLTQGIDRSPGNSNRFRLLGTFGASTTIRLENNATIPPSQDQYAITLLPGLKSWKSET
jgi:hypothetical protein